MSGSGALDIPLRASQVSADLSDVEPEPTAYTDAQGIADGHLVPIPFGPFARVTRRVWDAYADREKRPDQALIGLRRLWALAASLPAEPDGSRILRQSDQSVWLVPNELGGLTLMFPDDR